MQIEDLEDPLRSDTTLLIAALLALGIPLAAKTHCTCELVAGATTFRTVWTFRQEDPKGRFATVKMQAQWDLGCPALPPAHPLCTLRNGLTYQRAFSATPRFTLRELATVETPDTWLEAAIRNLLILLTEIPRLNPQAIVRFGPRHAAFVPRTLTEAAKARFLRYVESPAKRHQLSAA